MQSPDAERAVEEIAQALGHGVSVEDLDGDLIAYSSHQASADQVRVNFLLSKKVPADVNAWQLSHGIATAVRPVVVPANASLGMHGRVCVPLLVRGFRVGYLWVLHEQDEEAPDAILAALPGVRPLLDRLAEQLLDTNTPESDARRRREAEFLAACLTVETDGEDVGEPGDIAWYPYSALHERPWASLLAALTRRLTLARPLPPRAPPQRILLCDGPNSAWSSPGFCSPCAPDS